MAKRQAEKQLTDRNYNDDDEVDQLADGPMREAPKAELERRPIRGLPKKRSQVPPPNGNGASPFGTPTASTFGASSSPFASPAAASKTPAASVNPFTSGGPSTAPKPNGATSTLPCPGSLISATRDDSSLASNYAALLGLNKSVISILQRLVDSDPFVDLAGALPRLLTSYRHERDTIEGKLKAGRSPKDASTTPAPTTASTAAAPDTIQSPEGLATAPVPPTVFSFGGSTIQKAASPLPSPALGLAPSFITTSSSGEQSSFALPIATSASIAPATPSIPSTTPESTSEPMPTAAPSAAQQPAKSTSRPGAFTKAAPARPSPLRFGTSGDDSSAENSATEEKEKPVDTASKATESAGVAAPIFSFGSATGTSNSGATKEPIASIFGNAASSTSPFGGPGSATAGALFGGASTAPPFGGSGPPTSLFGTNAPATPSSKSAFSFGGTSSGTFGGFGGFGGMSGATAGGTTPPKTGAGTFNRVGWAFGSNKSPTSSPSASAAPATTSAPVSGSTAAPAPAFSFAPAASSIVPSESGADSGAATEDETSGGNPENADATSSASAAAGEGEEGEQTLGEYRCAIHALVVAVEGAEKTWQNRNVCILKVKMDPNTGARRLLARSDANKRVYMNFRLHKMMKVDVADKPTVLTFLGFEGTAPTQFRVRFKTKELATEAKEAIEASVKALE